MLTRQHFPSPAFGNTLIIAEWPLEISPVHNSRVHSQVSRELKCLNVIPREGSSVRHAKANGRGSVIGPEAAASPRGTVAALIVKTVRESFSRPRNTFTYIPRRSAGFMAQFVLMYSMKL